MKEINEDLSKLRYVENSMYSNCQISQIDVYHDSIPFEILAAIFTKLTS